MKIGITERGDAGLNFEWVEKLCDANVIITKHLTTNNTRLIDSLINNKDKIILHVTCTGYGGTKVEPRVPTPNAVYDGVQELIRHGFPAKQIVLRTDPIFPTQVGIATVKAVWEKFSDTGISRCRYSVVDMYPHAKKRLLEAFDRLPFETFKAPKEMMEAVKAAVLTSNMPYEFESCAEDLPVQTGCISKKDLDILGIVTETEEGGFQRKGCMCLKGKTELLTEKRICPSGCLYCYWKD